VTELRFYLDSDGESPFEHWFGDLDAQAAAKVTVALARMELGNFSNAKPVGEGVLEYRIDWGPGYRVYFGRDGNVLVILLTGGTKKRQQRDIDTAKALWTDYKQRRPKARQKET
jgi:putative addiction module killer protein